MKRRSALGFLSALCCSLTLPHSRALAQSDPSTSIPSNLSDDDRFVLRHVNNGEGNTPYSKLSSEGDFGAPEKSIIFSPQSDLHMNVWHPVKKGSARLIVFSHAEFLSPSSYTDLFKHWASHGFVVVAPLHNDEEILSVISSNSRRPQFHWPDYLTGELVKGDDGVDIPLKYWLERPSALKRVIDVIPLLQQVTGLDIIVDRPLIAGHSLGAFAAQIILGATAQSGPASSDHLSLADPRYYGGLILTPQGHGVMGLTISSWDKLESPLWLLPVLAMILCLIWVTRLTIEQMLSPYHPRTSSILHGCEKQRCHLVPESILRAQSALSISFRKYALLLLDSCWLMEVMTKIS